MRSSGLPAAAPPPLAPATVPATVNVDQEKLPTGQVGFVDGRYLKNYARKSHRTLGDFLAANFARRSLEVLLAIGAEVTPGVEMVSCTGFRLCFVWEEEVFSITFSVMAHIKAWLRDSFSISLSPHSMSTAKPAWRVLSFEEDLSKHSVNQPLNTHRGDGPFVGPSSFDNGLPPWKWDVVNIPTAELMDAMFEKTIGPWIQTALRNLLLLSGKRKAAAVEETTLEAMQTGKRKAAAVEETTLEAMQTTLEAMQTRLQSLEAEVALLKRARTK